MLSRTAVRVAQRPAYPAIRGLAFAANARPSAIALGKRPAVAPRMALPLASMQTSRAFSWTPWRSEAPVAPSAATPTTATPTEQLAGATATTEQPLSSLSASSAAPTANTTPEAILNAGTAIPTPSSSIADTAAALPPASATDPGLLPQHPAFPSTPSLEELITHSGKSLSEVLHSPEAVHAAIKVSDLKLVGLEHGMLNLSGWVRDALVAMHTATGLPWWASIAALTITLRLSLAPMLIRMTKHNVRLSAVQPQMTALFQRLNAAKQSKDPQAQQVVAQTLTNLMKENDVSPFRPLLMPLIQMPFFLAFFWGLRALATLPLPQLTEGGFGWVMDLTLADPYYILPITSMLFTNLVIRFGADGTSAAQGSNANMGHFRNALSVVSVIAVPFVGKMPAAVLLYWTFTNAFTLLQALLLKQPRVKSLLGIPTPPRAPPPPAGEIVNPNPSYAETWAAIRGQISGQGSILDRARQMQADAIAADRQKQGRAPQAKGMGGDVMYERVREAGQPASASSAVPAVAPGAVSSSVTRESSASPLAQAAQAGWMESESESTSGTDGGAQTGVKSKEAVKAARVAAARERRARH